MTMTEEEEKKIIRRGELTLDPMRHACTWKEKQVVLTVTEFLILEALAQRPGFVKSRDALMDAARVCSLGQITEAFFEVGGQYRRNV